ncbi:MAG: pilus assembly PilX N-terminal domain-containing protein [Syntrophobacteraceae bacterium]|jgi:hypothetical protein|nr:pilus assembly PilX N-terminal domain-containing protein [Syntrophobacteraceae bacterium]
MISMEKIREERGSTLLLSMLVISLLAVAGILSSRTSTTETRISRNDRLYKVAFYEAEGGAEASTELLEQNIEQRGFCSGLGANQVCRVVGMAIDTQISDDPSLKFYMNGALGAGVKPTSTAAGRDVYIPKGPDGATPPITNILIGGDTELSTGGAIQMIAGYEGKGKGAAGGGAWIIYDVRSRHLGLDSSESIVEMEWKHVM